MLSEGCQDIYKSCFKTIVDQTWAGNCEYVRSKEPTGPMT